MVVAIWCGNGKPPLTNYLFPWVFELRSIIKDKIEINGYTISTYIGWFACDTPARSYLKSEFDYI